MGLLFFPGKCAVLAKQHGEISRFLRRRTAPVLREKPHLDLSNRHLDPCFSGSSEVLLELVTAASRRGSPCHRRDYQRSVVEYCSPVLLSWPAPGTPSCESAPRAG